MVDPLIQSLRDPAHMTRLGASEWDAMISRARPVALIGKLAARADAAGLGDQLPAAIQRQFASMSRLSRYNDEHLKAEVFFILHALREVGAPVMFLKGAAYALSGSPVAVGRLSSDIDILVPKDALESVEEVLQQVGWQGMKLDDYDQRYYREWMHEIPPMRHRHRATVVDVHHTILPLTARITPNPEALLLDAAEVAVGSHVALVPCAEDMVIHAAVHTFYDGDLNSRLRDIVDIHEMITDFAADAEFWTRLKARSDIHQAHVPIYYALHFAKRIMGTDLPEGLLENWPERPGAVARAAMNVLVPRSIAPPSDGGTPAASVISRWLLFLRSHWLRMPPLLLVRHLSTKTWRQATARLRRR